MAMKRSAENLEMESIDMAKCLILFSHTLNQNKPTKIFHTKTYDIFECKTCNKRFSSFQALGGHRASHKKPRLMPSAAADEAKPRARKMHECSICGVEFALGQALGGHMRRHRDRAARAESFPSSATDHHQLVPKLPVLRRSNSTNKRVFGLDLNLTPLENDLEYLFGKNLAPKVDPFLL